MCIHKYLVIVFVFDFLLTGFAQQVCNAPAGSFCRDYAALPTLCPPGYYCLGGTTTQQPLLCPVGTFNPNSGGSSSTDCQICPYFEEPTVDRTSCTVCQPGLYFVFDSGTGIGRCEQCAGGTTSSVNATTCDACLPGSYGDSTGICRECKPGFYTPISGTSQCIECPLGTFTYNVTSDRVYTALWGSQSVDECIDMPGAGTPLVCVPGTYKASSSICAPCPIGYYCPIMSDSETNLGSIKACPDGTSTEFTRAVRSYECVVPSSIPPFEYNFCQISQDDSQGLGSKSVTAMTSSLSRDVIYFTTSTAVYRLFVVQGNVQNVIDLIAGTEGISGNAFDAIGTEARFSALEAIAGDRETAASSVLVVADGNKIRLIKIYSREVILIGHANLISKAGGIAIKRNTIGSRIAYVSDMINNRIMGFNLETYAVFFVAGNTDPGFLDGLQNSARFARPQGLAFWEESDNSTAVLLVADSGNNVIRSINTETLYVSTWYKPLDKGDPSLRNPTGIFVTPRLGPSPNKPVVLVANGSNIVKMIQVLNTKTVSSLMTPNSNNQIIFAMTTGHPTSSFNYKEWYKQLLILDANALTIRSVVENQLITTPEAGGSIQNCRLACKYSNCSALQQTELCGNSFLDPGTDEVCDNGFRVDGGCDSTCAIKPGFTCPVGTSSCTDPCIGYNYTFENQLYCEVDCAAKTPRPGYTIDNHCEEHDINECEEFTSNCSTKAYCDNIPGSFRCLCFNSFFGDGSTCLTTAFTVYTVVDIPGSQASDFILNPLSPNELLETSKKNARKQLLNAYVNELYANMDVNLRSQSNFTLSTLDLALAHARLSVDPNNVNIARLELATYFATFEQAQNAAASTSPSQLDLPLSRAIYGNQATSGVKVMQNVKTRVHMANSLGSATMIEGWGMNITGIAYNRSCSVPGVTSRGGCWELEMIYVGGAAMPRAGDDSGTTQSSKNVLYLPRIDRDPVTFETLNPMQAFTMSSGMSFPCDTQASSNAGGTVQAGTICCLRGFNKTFRPHARFKEFLDSSAYQTGVPEEYCSTTQYFNDSYPAANLIYLDPENPNDGSTNDLVVGKIDGMPHSEVRLLETLDYTTRTFRVLLVLEEGDLREAGSLIQGDVGLDYNMTFFVGLANFRSLTGSVLATRNSRMFVTVRKSNTLTISSYGANQDPLVSNVALSLSRIKVTNFFDPVRYLFYLRPMFVIPSIYGSPDSGGIVPLGGIRVIKARGSVTGSDPNWKDACASSTGTDFWSNQSLAELVSYAQKQECVSSNLQICAPPITAKQIIEFGIALPENYITDQDFIDENPMSIQVQFMVNAKDSISQSNVRTTVNLGMELTTNGYTRICESRTASQNLMDIIQGNIYIGIATTPNEWATLMLKKTNIDVPGKVPSNSFEFNTTTVQGAVMTFAALGSPSYFEDPRNFGQFVNIHDIHTVHFLEPNGGKGGESPRFEQVKSMFLSGLAFDYKVDSGNRTAWLQPSVSLLQKCPLVPTVNSKMCLTRIDSTYRNSVLKRSLQNGLAEIRISDPSSITSLQNMMGNIFFEDGMNDEIRSMGTNFHSQLVSQLNLNNRYRRAYVVNPVVRWSDDAMQQQFAGANTYTVCSKIIAIGMITIQSAAGAPLGRRLLSTEYSQDLNLFNEFAMIHGRRMIESPPSLRSTRNLLQVSSSSSSSLEPTREQGSNSMVLDLDIPGYDSVSQLCKLILNAPYAKCNTFELRVRIQGEEALNVCRQERDGELGFRLEQGLISTLRDRAPSSQIVKLNLLSYFSEGCEAILAYADSQSPGRRLLQTVTVPPNLEAIVVSHAIASSENGIMQVYQKNVQYITNFLKSDVIAALLGGGGIIQFMTISPSHGDGYLNITLYINNVSSANRTVIADAITIIKNRTTDEMFWGYDADFSKNNAKQSHASWIVNILSIMAITLYMFECEFS